MRLALSALQCWYLSHVIFLRQLFYKIFIYLIEIHHNPKFAENLFKTENSHKGQKSIVALYRPLSSNNLAVRYKTSNNTSSILLITGPLCNACCGHFKHKGSWSAVDNSEIAGVQIGDMFINISFGALIEVDCFHTVYKHRGLCLNRNVY